MYSRTYGIEIEFMAPAGVSRQAVATALCAAGVPAFDASYSHARTTEWKVVTDGSLTDGSLTGGNGMELVSPPLQGHPGMLTIEKVSQVLVALGATVNRSCGLHVHVGASSPAMPVAAMRKLAAIYAEYEQVLDSLLPASRRGSANHYCNSVAANVRMENLAIAANASQIAQSIHGGSRYVKLNFSSFWKHGTVEFRHHSGTVDSAKINAWTKLCLRMVALACKEQAEPVANLTTSVSTSQRPRNRRLATIYDMLAQEGGCTRQQVATALGRRTMPPLNRILGNSGIQYREITRRRVHRYELVRNTVVTQVQTTGPVNHGPATLANLTARLDMQQDEVAFWQARVGMMSNLRGAA